MKRLHAWLCDNVAPAEFARLVEHYDGFGLGSRRLRVSLPPQSLCCAEFFHRSLRLLGQHGLLRGGLFFDCLADIRPFRAEEVRAIMREFRAGPRSRSKSCDDSPILVWKVLAAGLTLL